MDDIALVPDDFARVVAISIARGGPRGATQATERVKIGGVVIRPTVQN